MPEMMRAVGFTEFGDPSVLHIVTVPKPAPGPGQVLVNIPPAKEDLAVRRLNHPGNHLHRRRLAGSIRPQVAKHLTL